MCVRMCVHVCVRACVRKCPCVCARVSVGVWAPTDLGRHQLDEFIVPPVVAVEGLDRVPARLQRRTTRCNAAQHIPPVLSSSGSAAPRVPQGPLLT